MSTTEEQLLSVTDLQIAYGAEPAVSGVSFTVGRGEVVAVVGESGSGKSTTAHAILGLLAGSGHVTGGTVEFEGEQIDSYSDRAWQRIRGARIGLVPQDPTTSLNPVTRIGDQVAEVLRIHGLADRRKARLDAVEVLERAGIDRPEIRARQYPHELSGGMRQRVLIGIALVANPALVIADEPTSALDVTVQRRILDHLDERIAESGAAVLLITHDLGVAADRADRILVMQGGRIVESGRTADILDNPRDEYTKKLLSSAPSLSSGPVVRPVRQDTSPLLTLTGITKHFNVGRGSSITAVNEVSLTVPRGQTVSLVGESGSGKSTTARIAVRLEQADAGTMSDPFRPLSLKPRAATRARENLSPLERYEIGQLKLVAVVWDIKEPKAMVEDATGLGYIVKIGTLIGPNEGKIKAIKPAEVVIEESFVDFYGAKKSQEISMKLPVEQ